MRFRAVFQTIVCFGQIFVMRCVVDTVLEEKVHEPVLLWSCVISINIFYSQPMQIRLLYKIKDSLCMIIDLWGVIKVLLQWAMQKYNKIAHLQAYVPSYLDYQCTMNLVRDKFYGMLQPRNNACIMEAQLPE